MKRRLIMKFGGALVEEVGAFDELAEAILERRRQFPEVCVVVSAMGAMTDELITLAQKVHRDPPAREVDMLISAGERISMALLAMAIAKRGGQAVSLTGSQSGIITCAQHAKARIVDVRPVRLAEHLEKGDIVIVAGFQGVSQGKEITTLGRGGSDTTAVALGVALDAERVELYKDVGALFSKDPKQYPDAYPFSSLTYDEALKVVGTKSSPVSPRALFLAKQNSLPLHILGLHTEGTLVGGELQGNKCQEKVFEAALGA